MYWPLSNINFPCFNFFSVLVDIWPLNTVPKAPSPIFLPQSMFEGRISQLSYLKENFDKQISVVLPCRVWDFENWTSAATFMLIKLWTRSKKSKLSPQLRYGNFYFYLGGDMTNRYLDSSEQPSSELLVFNLLSWNPDNFVFNIFSDSIFIIFCKILIINVTFRETVSELTASTNFVISSIGKTKCIQIFKYELHFGLQLHKNHIIKYSI